MKPSILSSSRAFLGRAAAVAGLIALVAVANPIAQTGGLPPLIDRELFFGNPEISTGTISPDGRHMAFRKPWNGTMNIWVKWVEEPFDRATRLRAETRRPVPVFFWSRDSKYILFVQDQGGDENYNVYAVSPSESPAAGKDVPTARNLTDAKGARAVICGRLCGVSIHRRAAAQGRLHRHVPQLRRDEAEIDAQARDGGGRGRGGHRPCGHVHGMEGGGQVCRR